MQTVGAVVTGTFKGDTHLWTATDQAAVLPPKPSLHRAALKLPAESGQLSGGTSRAGCF